MTGMDYEAGRFWLALALGVINILGTVGVGVYAWIVAQSKNSTQHIKALETVFLQKIGEYGSRIDKVETHMSYMPTPQQLSNMQGDLREFGAIQKSQHESNHQKLTALTLSMQRVEDYLMERK